MSTVIEGVNHFGRDAVDRRAIRELVDAWAHHADRRRPAEQAALFTPDGTVSVYAGDPASTEAVQRLVTVEHDGALPVEMGRDNAPARRHPDRGHVELRAAHATAPAEPEP